MLPTLKVLLYKGSAEWIIRHVKRWEMAILELHNDNDYHDFLEDEELTFHQSCPDASSLGSNARREPKPADPPKRTKPHTMSALPSASIKFKFAPPNAVWKEYLPFFEQLEKYAPETDERSPKKGKSKKKNRERLPKASYDALVLDAYLHVCLNFPLGKKTKPEFKKIRILAEKLMGANDLLIELVTASSSCHHMQQSPVETYFKVFQQGKLKEKSLTSKDFLTCDCSSGQGLQAWALTSLHLYLSERSPLSFTAMQFDNLG